MADEFNASFVEGGIIHGEDIPTPSGETGADGKSAYELAVENGYDGTVTEWLESLKGEKGDKGDRGEKGADGAQGIQGVQGKRGEKGADGKSAYELAVDNGFSGTLSEWLNSLKGADGKDGKDGAKGDKGDKGDTGERGAQGIQGVQGEKGDKGDTGAQGLKGDSGVEQQIVIDSAVTAYTIKPNILYVFPTLVELTVSFDLTDLNPNIVSDFHFQFVNGSTPCELNLPENVNIGDYEPQANGVCEISIVNGLMSYQNWSVEE